MYPQPGDPDFATSASRPQVTQHVLMWILWATVALGGACPNAPEVTPESAAVASKPDIASPFLSAPAPVPQLASNAAALFTVRKLPSFDE